MNRRFMSYNQWIRLNPDALEVIKCPKCGGKGLIETTCQCCGSEIFVSCLECDETGEIEDGHAAYEKAKEKDKKLLELSVFVS